MRLQRGLGLVGLILILGVGGVFAVLGLKLTPVYLDHMAIKRALVATAQSPESKNASVNDLRKSLDRRFEVDNVKVINSSDVDITKGGGTPQLSVSYSVKVHLFYNASLCIDFEASSSS